MTIASAYGLAPKSFANKEADWDTDVVKALLADSTYVPDLDTHQYLSSITGELAVAGYGRATLANKTSTFDAATNKTILSADPFSFPAITGAFRYLVYFVDTGVAATSPLVALIDFETDQTATSQQVNITPNAGGILTFTANPI